MARQREFMNKIRTLWGETQPAACVETFGCQQNVADGQRLMGMLEACGFRFTGKPEKAVLVNTCAVREHAEQRVFGNLGILTHTKKENPRQVIVLCGCMAQEERVANRVRESYRHVDLVFGPQALWKFPELLWQVYESRKRGFSIQDEHGSIAEGIPVVRERGVKAWVSIMYGCNNFCSYCIVPYVRGRERSRDPDAVLAEVRQLVREGYKDITLLGQNVNSYGNDLDISYDFADLLREIDQIEGEYWIRFMSCSKTAPLAVPVWKRPGFAGNEPPLYPRTVPGTGSVRKNCHAGTGINQRCNYRISWRDGSGGYGHRFSGKRNWV